MKISSISIISILFLAAFSANAVEIRKAEVDTIYVCEGKTTPVISKDKRYVSCQPGKVTKNTLFIGNALIKNGSAKVAKFGIDYAIPHGPFPAQVNGNKFSFMFIGNN
jgi:hypothetical protein